MDQQTLNLLKETPPHIADFITEPRNIRALRSLFNGYNIEQEDQEEIIEDVIMFGSGKISLGDLLESILFIAVLEENQEDRFVEELSPLITPLVNMVVDEWIARTEKQEPESIELLPDPSGEIVDPFASIPPTNPNNPPQPTHPAERLGKTIKKTSIKDE